MPLDISREAALKEEHEAYLARHPEIQQLLGDFISAALAEQPADLFAFARQHFAPPAELANAAKAAWPDTLGLNAGEVAARIQSDRPDAEVRAPTPRNA